MSETVLPGARQLSNLNAISLQKNISTEQIAAALSFTGKSWSTGQRACLSKQYAQKPIKAGTTEPYLSSFLLIIPHKYRQYQLNLPTTGKDCLSDKS
ncbi:MAG: hypothetical protein AB8B63_20100 [Granulosicoccus sp.]